MGDGLVSGAWSLRVRNPDRTVGAFGEYTSATLIERFNTPDTLQVSGRAADLSDFAILGSGCTLADDSGARRFNGPLTQLIRRGDGTCTLTWTSDLIWLWDRIVYPNSAQAITGQSVDYDVRTGPAETVLLAYANANAGPGALSSRRVGGLTVPASAGRGGTVKITARLDVLGRLVADIAEAANLRVRVIQSGTSLALVVTDVPDLSATALYGSADSGGPGLLADDWTWTLTRPTVTDAITAGGGEGAARIFREAIDANALSRWGARVELLVDQRQTTDTAELDQAGADALTAGSEPVEISATVLDSPDLRIGVDVPLGARVTLDLAGELVVDRLRQVTTTITVQDGSPTVQTVPLVGSPDAGLTRDQREFIAMRRTLRKVATR
jgi:ReqiPepy6 Gp37-like protein